MSRLVLSAALLFVVAMPSLGAAPQTADTRATPILTAVEAGKLMPATVFFQGLSASIQTRNSAGIRFATDSYLLVALVDTSGYSSQVQQKYQAYLITEEPINLGGHRLAPGAYGCGFIANNKFVLMDIGGHDLFTTSSTRDASLRRPTPLQILLADSHYRLYVGRNYVELAVPVR